MFFSKLIKWTIFFSKLIKCSMSFSKLIKWLSWLRSTIQRKATNLSFEPVQRKWSGWFKDFNPGYKMPSTDDYKWLYPSLEAQDHVHWRCLWLCYTFIDRHPMVVSMVLRARSFRDVCFVSDSVTEPRPGAVIKYNDRQSKNGCLVTSDGCLVTSDSCLVTKVSFPGSCPPMYVCEPGNEITKSLLFS